MDYNTALNRKIKNYLKGNSSVMLQTATTLSIAVGIVSLFFVNFTWPLFLLFVFMYFMVMGFGVSITYHRTLTHKSLTMHPVVLYLGKFFASMAGTGSPIGWVMTHRQHHRYADTAKDPHPPHKVPKTLLGQYPRVETLGMRQYAESWFNRFLHRYYFALFYLYGLVWLTVGYLTMGTADLFFYGFLYPALASVIASNALNRFGHIKTSIGYRSHETNDNSENYPILGFLVWGEGWHNNHHKYPGSATFGNKWYEFDFSFFVIRILEKLNLVKNVRLPG